MGYARYRDWLIDMSRMCAKHPLDCDFLCEAWLLKWTALGMVLGCVARIEWRFTRGRWHPWEIATVGELLLFDHRAEMREDELRRIRLFDGTIVREWGPK